MCGGRGGVWTAGCSTTPRHTHAASLSRAPVPPNWQSGRRITLCTPSSRGRDVSEYISTLSRQNTPLSHPLSPETPYWPAPSSKARCWSCIISTPDLRTSSFCLFMYPKIRLTLARISRSLSVLSGAGESGKYTRPYGKPARQYRKHITQTVRKTPL